MVSIPRFTLYLTISINPGCRVGSPPPNLALLTPLFFNRQRHCLTTSVLNINVFSLHARQNLHERSHLRFNRIHTLCGIFHTFFLGSEYKSVYRAGVKIYRANVLRSFLLCSFFSASRSICSRVIHL